MVISVKHSRIDIWKSPLTVVFVSKGDKSSTVKDLTQVFGNVVGKIISNPEFSAEAESVHYLYGNSATKSERILLVGIGKVEKNFDLEVLRRGAARAVRIARKSQVDHLSYFYPHTLDGLIPDRSYVSQAIIEGCLVGNYRFDTYLPKEPATLKSITVVSETVPLDQIKRGCNAGKTISAAVNFARSLGDMPGNSLTPTVFARKTAEMCKKWKVNHKLLDEKKLAALGMNGILSVGSGSYQPSCMIQMEYKPPSYSNKKPIILVGKAVTFDSGGISIKSASEMDRMKFDMCGGGTVAGIMQAVASLQLKIHVIGIIPSAENLVGDKAYKPGDIIKTYSGKTVEIINTDAEGRMLLADALAYAAKKKPEVIIDFATLTGAVVVALGYLAAGMFGTAGKVKEKLNDASKRTSERIWELPLWKEYETVMKSKIADVKNSGGRWGGASTAAAFLKQFVGSVPWVHLDIAGVANNEEATAYTDQISATGFGVRLVTDMLQNWSKRQP